MNRKVVLTTQYLEISTFQIAPPENSHIPRRETTWVGGSWEARGETVSRSKEEEWNRSLMMPLMSFGPLGKSIIKDHCRILWVSRKYLFYIDFAVCDWLFPNFWKSIANQFDARSSFPSPPALIATSPGLTSTNFKFKSHPWHCPTWHATRWAINNFQFYNTWLVVV